MRKPALALAILAVIALGDGLRSQQTLTTRPQPFRLMSILAGDEPVWPFRIHALDPLGSPTEELLEVRSRDVLEKHRTPGNPVLPPARFPSRPALPDGSTGNQFLLFQFTRSVDLATVLRFNRIQVVAYDAATETTSVIRGRWFVGGVTSDADDPDGTLRVVQETGDGLAIVHPEGDGFPSGFQGDALLGRPSSVVFVADPDGDLRTPDAFPSGVLIRIIVSSVQSTDGKLLETEVAVATSRDGQ